MAEVAVIGSGRIAEFSELSQEALGVSPVALHKTPDVRSLQEGLQPWHFSATALLDLVGTPEAAQVWLHTPNPDLDGHTPLALMQAGEAEVVAALLRDALVGQPARGWRTQHTSRHWRLR